MHSAKLSPRTTGAPGIQVDPVHIHGVLSLVFWSMMLVVTFKYVLTIMKADNKGEGGSLALLALINRKSENAEKRWTCADRAARRVRDRAVLWRFDDYPGDVGALGHRGAQLRQSPASRAGSCRSRWRSLFALFAIQARGTAKVGKLFGPIMVLYFTDTGGARPDAPDVRCPMVILETMNPVNAIKFFMTDGFSAFVAMGAVVLAVTGAEALYADMGHFGRAADRAQLADLRPARADAQLYGAGCDGPVDDADAGAQRR
jgi:KUP system potassium uptake protein